MLWINFAFQQWFAGCAAAFLVMQPGIMAGWTSPTLATLTSPNSPIPLDTRQASWVASLVNAGRLIGAILGPCLASTVGSKRAISITLWPIILGWLFIFLADSVVWLYAARACLGVGLGMAFGAFPLFIGEVSMPEIRGALISLASVGSPVGQLIASICGSYLRIPEAAAIYIVLALLLMSIFFWFPDSPHYLIKIGNRKGAQRAIHWYRDGRGVDKELEAVEKFVTQNGEKSFGDKLKELKKPAIRRATLQIIVLFTFMQICGLNSVLFYMELILKSANFTLINPGQVVIYVSLCGIIAAMLSITLIDRCGRKFLLIVSGFGLTVSMLAMCGHFFLISINRTIPEFEWVPMASMFLFVISFFGGLFPVPSAILSETFPADYKSIAACIASITGAVMSFLSSKTYQPMVDSFGETYVFLIYAACACLIIPYAVLGVSETKGKSLQQIQDELVQK